MCRTPFYQTLNELEHHFLNINRTQTCSSTFKLFCNLMWFLRAVSFLLSTTFCDRVSHLVRSGLNSFPSRSVVRWFQLSMIRIPPAGGIVNPVKIFPDLACCFSTGKTGKKCNYHQVFTSSFASIVLTKLFVCHFFAKVTEFFSYRKKIPASFFVKAVKLSINLQMHTRV